MSVVTQIHSLIADFVSLDGFRRLGYIDRYYNPWSNTFN